MAITTKGTYELYKCTNSIRTFVAPYNGLYKVIVAGGRNGVITGSSNVSIKCKRKDELGTHHHKATFDEKLMKTSTNVAYGYVVLKKGDILYVDVGGDGEETCYTAREGGQSVYNENPPTVSVCGSAGYNSTEDSNALTERSTFTSIGTSTPSAHNQSTHTGKSPNYLLTASPGGTTTVKSADSSVVVSMTGRSEAYVVYYLDLYQIGADVRQSHDIGNSGSGFADTKVVVYKNKSYEYSTINYAEGSDCFPFTWDGSPCACIQLVDRDFPIYCGDSEIYKVCLGDSEIIDLKL